MNKNINKITANIIWESFTNDERAQACEAIWAVKDENLHNKEAREEANVNLAKVFNSNNALFFRRKSAKEKGKILCDYSVVRHI